MKITDKMVRGFEYMANNVSPCFVAFIGFSMFFVFCFFLLWKAGEYDIQNYPVQYPYSSQIDTYR